MKNLPLLDAKMIIYSVSKTLDSRASWEVIEELVKDYNTEYFISRLPKQRDGETDKKFELRRELYSSQEQAKLVDVNKALRELKNRIYSDF